MAAPTDLRRARSHGGRARSSSSIALKANPPAASRLGDTGDLFFYLSTKTGLFLPVAALRVMSRFLLVIVVALFAGDAIASRGELGQPACAARPADRARPPAGRRSSRRPRCSALIATALIVVTGLIAGGIAFGWHPIGSALSFGLAHGRRAVDAPLAVQSRHRGALRVLEPVERHRVRVHGVDDDRLARRRGLRRASGSTSSRRSSTASRRSARSATGSRPTTSTRGTRSSGPRADSTDSPRGRSRAGPPT